MRERITQRLAGGDADRRGGALPRDHAPPPRRGARLPASTTLLVVVVVVVLALLAVVVTGLERFAGGVHNPFASRQVDRSQPVLLQSIQDLSDYKAATGNFEVVVDLQKETPLIPSLVKGERTLFVAAGSVDAQVDFSGLSKDAIKVSPDGKSVSVSLPHAGLSRAVVDPDRSYVFSRSRGLLDRLGSVFSDNPTSERELYQLSEQKLGEAARASGLTDRAERNTRAMLTSMLRSLGYQRVTVTFDRPAKT
jgi:Protein of unknown function (DUF4230)